MTELAEVLGRSADAEYFQNQYNETVLSFRNEFYDSKKGRYSIGAQGTEAFANKLGAIRERELCEVKQYLEKHITKECEGNLDTGIFGTPLLFETLVEFGLGEVAYHMITSVTYPSYGYMITNGATTLWEYWEKEYGFYQCPANHNQPMFGSISSFFYEKLAGIKPLKPAYKKIEIKPAMIGDLRFVSSSVKTPYGEVCIDWERNEDEILVSVVIPPNTDAVLLIPGQERKEIGSGNYQFRYVACEK